MAGKQPLIIDTNLRIKGEVVDQTKPLDDRYGPWKNLTQALNNLYVPARSINYVYYGLTIGINVYETPGVYTGDVIGVDEYWWQPKCILNENYDPEDPTSEEYVDGFIKKYPSNTPATVSEDGNDKVLGLAATTTSVGAKTYGWATSAVWADDERGSDWHDMDPETLEDVGTEDP